VTSTKEGWNDIYDLKTLYELRKTLPLKTRKVVARLFFAMGKPGLVDASGCLWPIAMANDVALPTQEGIVTGQLSAFRADGALSSKYEDQGFTLRLEAVSGWVPSLVEWKNSVLPSPVPNLASQSELSSLPHTRFFTTPTSARQKHLQAREEALERTRNFFKNRGFLLAETPTLVPSGGVESYLNSFFTEYKDHRGKKWRLSLPTSPEFALKKLVAEGFSKVFQISRAYRNVGELSKWHEPEFLMLEWYRTGSTLEQMMADTRSLVNVLVDILPTQWNVPEQWPNFRVNSLFQELLGLDLEKFQIPEKFRDAAAKKSISIVETDDWDSVFCKLFMEYVEPFLQEQGACFVTHYPIQMAALAEPDENPFFAKRFEAYLRGVEICNGYQELTDSLELTNRFNKVTHLRGEFAARDEVFENTMRFGFPPCAGNALGIDRVIALLLGLENVSSLFPIPFLSQFPAGSVAPE
jgi:lysyl-tRNA synthetase class 2